MRDVRVKLKTGGSFQAPLWQWRPELGWFSLAGGDVILLIDVESATTRERRHVDAPEEDVDMLERARKEGWNGS